MPPILELLVVRRPVLQIEDKRRPKDEATLLKADTALRKCNAQTERTNESARKLNGN